MWMLLLVCLILFKGDWLDWPRTGAGQVEVRRTLRNWVIDGLISIVLEFPRNYWDWFNFPMILFVWIDSPCQNLLNTYTLLNTWCTRRHWDPSRRRKIMQCCQPDKLNHSWSRVVDTSSRSSLLRTKTEEVICGHRTVPPWLFSLFPENCVFQIWKRHMGHKGNQLTTNVLQAPLRFGRWLVFWHTQK